jgi:hypothetical protein
MIFFMNLPWGIVMPIHLVKCTKLITLYAFFNLVANVQILPRHFLPVFVMEWCLRSSDTLSPCNCPVFFWGGEYFLYLGAFKKKINKIGPCLLYFKNILKILFFGGRKRPVGTWWVNT